MAGAGADVTNVILSKTNAFIENAVLGTVGDVTITALDDSTISATVTSVAASAGVGAFGGAVSIGVVIAHNFIGYKLDGTEDAVEVQAYVHNASITSSGALQLKADGDATISSTVIAGSLAIGVGGVAISAVGSGQHE